jgi:heme/copper-type cytochrome/quinol oxidase subunit 2
MVSFGWGEVGVLLVMCGMSAYCAFKYRRTAQDEACKSCMESMQVQMEMRIEERVTRTCAVAYDDGYRDGRHDERTQGEGG